MIHKSYQDLISIENLFQAWGEFKIGKRKRRDVQVFERNLEDNLYNLFYALRTKTYKHGTYEQFFVHDPKTRHIHKALIRDRIIHHLLYKYLYECFDKSFICDSYSCRLNKGTHKGVVRLEKFTRKASRNYTRPCWALKCDIKKFFANVDHQILMSLLRKKVIDPDILWLIETIVKSFHSESGEGRGIPLGNLTSQVFANIYMNELDQLVKNELRIKFYLRYADDFLILSGDKATLQRTLVPIADFLEESLRLELRPEKIIIRKLDWGIDFLGYVVLPHYILPRTKTKKRIFHKLTAARFHDVNHFNQSLQSYLGYLQHANSFALRQRLKNQVWFWGNTL